MAKAEAERLAEEQRLEAERLAKAEAARLEAELVAEAERLAEEQRLEAERLAKAKQRGRAGGESRSGAFGGRAAPGSGAFSESRSSADRSGAGGQS